MNIYKDTLDSVFHGSKFSVDLIEKTLKVGGTTIINKERYSEELGIGRMTVDEALEVIEDLYHRYKHSIPSERSDSHRTCFKALKEEDLSSEDMLYGEAREFALFHLELTLLLLVLNGSLRWREEWGTWFWQSPNDRDLVIFRWWL